MSEHDDRVAAVRRYILRVQQVAALGSGTPETSFYPALNELLDAVGETLQPRRFAVSQLANTGAGFPDYGIFGEHDAPGSPPSNVLEAKALGDDSLSTAETPQVSKYAEHYEAVLITNFHQFLIVARSEAGAQRIEQRYLLAESASDLLTADASHLAGATADGLWTYLEVALSRTASIRSGAVLAEVLASYAHEALARLEDAPGDDLEQLRLTLEQMLGIQFEDDDEGRHFFHSSLIQTLFYGLFSAWVLESRDQADDWIFDWRLAGDHAEIPLIGTLFAEAAQPLRLARLGLRDTMDWAQSALNRVDRTQFHQEFETQSAIQYFYEPFLHAFDPHLRSELGVWYTPREVVRYQVAKVDRLLREELGIEGGLANEQVTVLDPAVGTGSYLIEVARTIHESLSSDADTAALAAASVAKALRTRIFGFELLPAPFVVAHLQLMVFLSDIGGSLSQDERVGVYLTNALTGWKEETEPPVPLWDEVFEEEREAASHVKHDVPIIVVLGNPPYARYASAAVAEEHDLIAFYKGQVDRNGTPHTPSLLYTEWGIGKQTLDDLYIRFFRLAERSIRAAGRGIVSLITNSGWLAGASNPIMRESLLEGFDQIWIDDLHGGAHSGGNAPANEADGSVFTQGASSGIALAVAVTTLVRREQEMAVGATVAYRSIWGTPSQKRERLLAGTTEYDTLAPRPELRWSFRPIEGVGTEEFLTWLPLHGGVFRSRYSGVHTGRDPVVVSRSREQLRQLSALYYDPSRSDAEIAAVEPRLMTPANEFDDPPGVRQALLAESDAEVGEYAFRPFDYQWLWWERHTKLIQRNSEDLHDMVGGENVLLVTDARQYARRGTGWDGVYVTRRLPASKITQAGCKVFPRFVVSEVLGVRLSEPNVRLELARSVMASTGESEPVHEELLEVADQLFFHTIAVMAAPMYRYEYWDELVANGARIPIPADLALLEASAALGRRVSDLFDMDASVDGVTTGELDPRLSGLCVLQRADGAQVAEEDLVVQFGRSQVEGGRWVERESPLEDTALGEAAFDVLLNPNVHFANIPSGVAEYSTGQYPVLRKWLSYRRHADIGSPIGLDEARTFRLIALRIASIILMSGELNANFLMVKSAPLVATDVLAVEEDGDDVDEPEQNDSED